MRAVFLDRSTLTDDIDFSLIEQQLTNISYFALTPSEKVVYRCKYANIIITNKVVIDRNIMRSLPKLKVICIAATGTNNVDLEAAQELGIAVFNVSGYSNQSVSQYVFAMLLEVMQKSSRYIADCREGAWQQSPMFCHHSLPIEELADKKIAIIGFGALGKSVAKIAQAFEMQVLVAERQHAQQVRPGRVSFEQAITEADVVSIHCPLVNENHHQFNHQIFTQMKRSAILINTARGGLVNSSDLALALKAKKIRAAILDVLEEEPPKADHPLLQGKIDNLYLTAHIAWASQEAQQRLVNGIAANISAFCNNVSHNRVV